MKFLSSIIGLLLLLSPIAEKAQAQEDISPKACQDAYSAELAKRQREYRGILFGFPKAEDVPVGHVRFSGIGEPYVKVQEDGWRTVEYENTISNEDMDGTYEFSEYLERKGIFETRRMLTSELIPYITQSYRALQCQAESVCSAALLSIREDSLAPRPITVHTRGCIELEMESIPQCHFGGVNNNQPNVDDLVQFCSNIAQEMLIQESQALRLSVEYDAAYRSSLQFAGNFDLFIKEFRWPLMNSIRASAYMIGSLNRIPCFLSSCDDYLEAPPF